MELKELPSDTPDDQVVKLVALAHELGIKPQMVYGWLRSGGLQAYTKDGQGRYLIRGEFAEWQKSRRTQQTAPKPKESSVTVGPITVRGPAEDDEPEEYTG